MLLAVCACSALNPDPAGEVLLQREPDLSEEYVLYKPSHYNHDREWPLLTLCHASPWDTPQAVVRKWADLAEEKGFLLLAPRLQGVSDWTGDADEQRGAQERDERVTLSALQHVRAACRVASDRLAIAGATGGARAALFIGLRHPETFRMVALLKPRFDVQHVSAVHSGVDPYQRVLVLSGMGGWYRDQVRACLEWLREGGLTPQEILTNDRPGEYPRIVHRFFRDTVQRHPWIHIEVRGSDSPLGLRLAARTTLPEVHKYEWEFGDGASDVVAAPEHRYAEPGEYVVTLRLYADRNTVHLRRRLVTVP